ncbi:MarR family transcriptional regulator [Chromobacterium subtsugae]|uniref:MarR family transcriptional regulator n=1 Tax=Chromobacterium subtsugae TaxID=251747 RepID=A0ABS7FGS9_9NEIS|nr:MULTISPECIES: MarR family transcriptional regulator [Chromobacterium]KUM05696.1 MarR family transcriptional regulator [Chromobacterium subtsugae]KZE84608.1 MarR family transcriptional regulator [Chromobacterium sp. F49]MBW7568185.1 MarR family transcriptional regulator [Chromobacterium subtsugae]MBW8289296.1 MarR family transcriptional regulator [Chromobacterium subtsugae]WSE90380.1 MarR family transcriptional regulator [Chromobacterium subtsugae]
MAVQREGDAVDRILAQWARERPDLDASPMGVIGRLNRCAALLSQRMDAVFGQYGLSGWEFDMLATLRRSGAPYCLAPTELFSSLMVTSGTMTHRLKVLEGKGWISREASAQDARSTLVRLSEAGFALIERALEAHVANEHAILSALRPRSLDALEKRLAELLAALEDATAASGKR